jgi:Xaa-Pro aminopeptidase
MSNKQEFRIMRTPSFKAAQDRLRRTLEGVDDAHTRAVANLPPGHSWADIDQLEIKRCDAAIHAHQAFKAEWDAYVAAHADDEDAR